MRRQVLTLLLLSGLTFFLGLGRQAITDSDEAFYAEAAREMVEGQDWLTPHFNYEERWQKPILYYWVTAAAFAGTDTTEFMARFGSALSGLGLVLPDVGRGAGSPGTRTAPGSRARLQRPVTATSLWRGSRCLICRSPSSSRRRFGARCAPRIPVETIPASWAALAGLAAGLGFLTKGPLAVVIPAIVLVPIWWRERRTVAAGLTRPALRVSHVAIAAVLFAISGLPWYVAMWLKHGTPYLQSFFLADNLERFATTRYNDVRAIWYYVPILLGGLVPWTIFLLVLPWRPLRDLMQRRRRLTNDEWRLLIWTIAPLLLFTASVGKQPRYILPVLPPIAMMLGTGIANRVSSPRNRAASRELTVATLVTAVMFALMAVLFYRDRVLFVSAHPAIRGPASSSSPSRRPPSRRLPSRGRGGSCLLSWRYPPSFCS